MKKLLITLLSVGVLQTVWSQGTGSNCMDLLPFCTGQTYNYNAGVNSGTAQSGPNYGCLMTQPNPVWYVMQIDQPGNIDIYMVGSNTNNVNNPTNDIDFICYGPFMSLNGVCPNQLTAANTVDCSYSSLATETVNITNAPSGAFYVLLITNYSNTPANIIFSQTGGTGTTDCGIFASAGNNGPLCVGQSLQLTVDTPYTSGPYIFNWSGPNGFTSTLQNPSIPNSQVSMAGTYTVIITDLSNFESDTSSTNVIINTVPAAPMFMPTPICEGQQFCLSPVNPIQGATYTWSTPNGLNSNAVPYCNIGSINLWNGINMSLTVTINGCTSPPFTAPLMVNPVPPISITGPTEGCEGTNVTLTANPGTYQSYTWSASNSTTNTASVATGASYTVSTTVNGCTGTSAPYQVAATPNPLTLTGNVPYCSNDSITVTATNGKTSYVWNGVQGGSTLIVNGNTPNPIILTVTSANGCARTDTFDLTIKPAPVVNFGPSVFCDGSTVQFTDSSTVTGNATINGYFWDFGSGNVDNTQNPSYTFPNPGTYQVTHVVTTTEGCMETIVKDVKVYTKPKANFIATPLCFGVVLIQDSTVVGDSAIHSSVFSFSNGLDNKVNEPQFEITIENQDSIVVTYIVTDVNGCTDDTVKTVIITDTPDFTKLPNVITPSNADVSGGTLIGNDYFDLGPNGIIFDKCYDYSIQFFNRWGQKVYTINNSSKKFEGKNESGQMLATGVYYYVIMADGKKRFGGSVTVL